MLTVGSLFSGVGGLDLGLEQAGGFEIRWQCENDPYCRKVLARHWPDVDLNGDVKDVGRTTLASCDLLCGGFPCTDLSVAGRRKGLAGEGSGLWWEFHRLIGELSPTWVLIENVVGLLSSNGGEDLAVILHGLEELRYGWNFRILDSQYFGVPQRRRRVFIVGHFGGVCPPEILLESEGVCGDTEEVDEQGKEVAGTLGGGTNSEGVSWYERHDQDGRVIDLTGKPTQTLSANADNACDLPLVLAHSSQGGADRPPTLSPIPDAVPRRLTPRECERLQGFPDDWTRYADDGTELVDAPRYRMMGNAVTVNVAEWIGRRLMETCFIPSEGETL